MKKGRNIVLRFKQNEYRESTLENLRELVEYAYHDIFIKYHDHEYILYSDHGGASIETPDNGYFRYDNYDEMIKAPIFEGKSLEEIVGEIDATY